MASRKKKPQRDAARAENPASRTPASWFLAIVVALVVLAVGIYAQTASHGFVDLDDTGYVVTNPHVTGGLTAENVAWAFSSTYAANWHPVTWISHQLDVSMFGVAPGRHHLTSLFWHVIATLLLFGCLRSMTGSFWRSAFVAAAFAAHPAHVESVAWIAERKDVLSAVFWFLTTWVYVVWTRKHSAGWYALVLACFSLGLMAKPMLVTLPFTLLLLDYWPLDRATGRWRERVIEKIPLFALAAVSSVVTTIAQERGGAVGSLDLIPVGDRIANAALSYGRYLKMLVWPGDHAVFYPYLRPVPYGMAIAVAVGLAIITALVWRGRRNQPALVTGWLWFLGTLVPVIGLVQVGTQAIADRYTYVPSVGLFIVIAWSAEAIARRVQLPRVVLVSVAAGVIAFFAVVARGQVATWASAETLWRQAVAVAPSAQAHNSLGVAFGNSGRATEAAEQFQIAVKLPLDVATARFLLPNLSRALMSQGKIAEALPHLERARDISRDNPVAWHQLALGYFGLERKDDAIAAWREAVRLNPRFEDAWFTMAIVLAANKREDDARNALRQVLAINPSRKDARDMLTALGGR